MMRLLIGSFYLLEKEKNREKLALGNNFNIFQQGTKKYYMYLFIQFMLLSYWPHMAQNHWLKNSVCDCKDLHMFNVIHVLKP